MRHRQDSQHEEMPKARHSYGGCANLSQEPKMVEPGAKMATIWIWLRFGYLPPAMTALMFSLAPSGSRGTSGLCSMEVANSSLESPGALQKFSKLIWRYHVCPFISIILSISQEKKSLLPPKTHCIDQAGRTYECFLSPNPPGAGNITGIFGTSPTKAMTKSIQTEQWEEFHASLMWQLTRPCCHYRDFPSVSPCQTTHTHNKLVDLPSLWQKMQQEESMSIPIHLKIRLIHIIIIHMYAISYYIMLNNIHCTVVPYYKWIIHWRSLK